MKDLDPAVFEGCAEALRKDRVITWRNRNIGARAMADLRGKRFSKQIERLRVAIYHALPERPKRLIPNGWEI